MGFVYEAVAANMMTVATNRYGCCVLQRCLDSSDPARCQPLVTAMVENAVHIVPDAYGNYAAQHLIKQYDSSVSTRFFEAIRGSIVQFVCEKHASCVIEVSVTVQ